MAAGPSPDRPRDELYVCPEGHVTAYGSWDEQHAAAVGTPHAYDYSQRCRRTVWVAAPSFSSPERCKEPVQLLRKHPALYSSYLLGGEDAVRAAMVGVELEDQHGQEIKGQG